MSDDAQPPWWRQPFRLVLIGFLAIAAFFLVTEHRAHVFGFLPFAFLLICPFMHFFMHRGHDDRGRYHRSLPEGRSSPGTGGPHAQ